MFKFINPNEVDESFELTIVEPMDITPKESCEISVKTTDDPSNVIRKSKEILDAFTDNVGEYGTEQYDFVFRFRGWADLGIRVKFKKLNMTQQKYNTLVLYFSIVLLHVMSKFHTLKYRGQALAMKQNIVDKCIRLVQEETLKLEYRGNFDMVAEENEYNAN